MSGPLMRGGAVDVSPSWIDAALVSLDVVNGDGRGAGVHLTPIEAIGLAQMLLKAANAEVPS